MIKDVEREEFEREVEARRAASVQEQGLQSIALGEVQELEERWEEWKEGCPWCRMWDGGGQGYGIADCRTEDAGEIRKGIEIMQGLVRWDRFSGSFNCRVPPEMVSTPQSIGSVVLTTTAQIMSPRRPNAMKSA